MTHEQTHLAAILANPSDDTVRLQFADWLDEHDQAERAEFIRVQVELAKYKPQRCPNRKDRTLPDKLVGFPVVIQGEDCQRCRWCQLRRRERELLGRHQGTWTLRMLDRLPDSNRSQLLQKTAANAHRVGGWPSDKSMFVFRRGFVAHVTLTCADWLRHRESLLASTPLEQVTLTNVSRTQPGTTVVVKRGQLCLLTFGPGEAGIDLSFPELALR